MLHIGIGMDKYLITTAFDTLPPEKQLIFGFKGQTSRRNFFRNIYIHNSDGFRVPFKKLLVAGNLINLFGFAKTKYFLFNLPSIFVFYVRYFRQLKLGLYETIFFYVSYKKIISSNKGIFFKVIEFNGRDFIFHMLVKNFNSKVVYFLHTMKPLSKIDKIFLKQISKSNYLYLIAPSQYHLELISKFIPTENLILSNYNSLLRVPGQKRFKFSDTSQYLVLLNGDRSDRLFLTEVERIFGNNLVIRPHPSDTSSFDYPIQISNMNTFRGVIYNKSSAILRLEWINLPKLFVAVLEDDVDILDDARMVSKDSLMINEEYILKKFHTLQDDENFWRRLSENFSSE